MSGENDANENSKSVSTVIQSIAVNEGIVELAVATSSGLGQDKTWMEQLEKVITEPTSEEHKEI